MQRNLKTIIIFSFGFMLSTSELIATPQFDSQESSDSDEKQQRTFSSPQIKITSSTSQKPALQRTSTIYKDLKQGEKKEKPALKRQRSEEQSLKQAKKPRIDRKPSQSGSLEKEEKQTPPLSEIVETTNPKEKAIEQIKTVRQQALKKQRSWRGVLKEEKLLRLQYKITDVDLGIQPQWAQDPQTIWNISPDQRLDAIQRVSPEKRYTIPRNLREETLETELIDVEGFEKEEKLDELEPVLALRTVPFTASQEAVLDIDLPSIDRKLTPLKRQQATLEAQRYQIEKKLEELDKKISGYSLGSIPDSLASEKKRLTRQLSDLERKIRPITEQRLALVVQQAPLIEKVTRGSASESKKD